jgi:uncharacterized protein (DUF2235 family)
MAGKSTAASSEQAAQVKVPTELVAEGVAAVAPAAAQTPQIDEASSKPKSIFLFADGTGNSSAKLFKTNVWRMYEALDLGRPAEGYRTQVAYYDNGVGTSNFRPLRLLGGIFGIGLKANVLRLYGFLCQNYRPGDRIYAFGFSRGAFTIRLLVGLVTSQGIIQKENDEPVPQYQVKDAYRHFCRTLRPHRWPRWLALMVQHIRDQFHRDWWITLRRKGYRQLDRHPAEVEFVGVWDTVAAYGGPFAEFTRGIDDWVWPLALPDYKLSTKVKKARHALSLDDERDAFQPLLWDEHHEQQLVDSGTVAKDRLKQVWFSGVHSDVGGGYPDESLSYIPLLWMMDELSPEGSKEAAFLDSFVQRAKDLANSGGPIHDSRAGLASYYRYQPRKLAAMLDPIDRRYIALRDPAIGTTDPGYLWIKRRLQALIRVMKHTGRRPRFVRLLLEQLAGPPGPTVPMPPTRRIIARAAFNLLGIPEPLKLRAWRNHGLLRHARIHESTIARIIFGIDSYAPAALPTNFKIIPAKGPRARAALTKADYDNFDRALPLKDQRFARQEAAWNLVWARRGIYFATVAATCTLLLLPVIGGLEGIESLCGDDRCFARALLEKPSFLLPTAAEPYWALYLAKPFTLILGAIVLLGLMTLGKGVERRFRNRVRQIWRETIGGSLGQVKITVNWQMIRESKLYQTILFDVKWRFLPGILGVATLAALITGASLLVTQVSYALGEKGELFCQDRSSPGSSTQSKAIAYDTKDSCLDLETYVRADHRYLISLTKVQGWVDGGDPNVFPWHRTGFAATPVNGIETRTFWMPLSKPFSRVTSANFMEPLTEVRTHHQPGIFGFVRKWALGPDIDIRTTDFVPNGDAYEMRFCPLRDGDLYFMVNDMGLLYANNSGSAEIMVQDLGKREANSAC